MFEAHVLHLLRVYLGEYVKGLSLEALKISVWQGDVVLNNLQLKAEALNALKLPITVKAGFLGSIRLKVPWNRLGKDPVIVLLDRIFILAEPSSDKPSSKEEEEETRQEAKRRRVEAAELALLEARDKKALPAASQGGSWIGSLVNTIVGNLKLSITNVHIRYEDAVSNLGHPFATGITLAKLAAVTIDENGIETFVTSGALDRLRKAVELERLAIYHDSNSQPWKLEKEWDEMSPEEWSEVFEPGIAKVASNRRVSLAAALTAEETHWARGRQYLLHPVNGKLRYLRQGKHDKRQAETPFQKATVTLDEVSLTLSEAQYSDGMKLLEVWSGYKTRLQFAHLRPATGTHGNAAPWWQYAYKSVLQQHNKLRQQVPWSKIERCCQLRRRYLELYMASLQSGVAGKSKVKVENEDVKAIEAELDAEVVILWRLLAHAQVERAKSREAAAERERLRKSHWFAFGWGSAAEPAPPGQSDEEEEEVEPKPRTLTTEEWSKINELIGLGMDANTTQEAPNMLQALIEITMRRNAARVVDLRGTEVVAGSFESFQVGLKLYPKTQVAHIQLQSYGVKSPEGALIQSVSRQGRENALTLKFVHGPLDDSLDWTLAAAVSPCHVTLWRASVDRLMHFFKSNKAVSAAVTLETAAALQSTLEAVRRSATAQLQAALEEAARFSIDLDIDAPKVAVPVSPRHAGQPATQLLLDLGHFTLKTDLEPPAGEASDGDANLYTRLRIRGSDIAAFLVDGSFDWAELPPQHPFQTAPKEGAGDAKQSIRILPVLDKCGLSAAVQYLRVSHPSLPSARIAARVPQLGFHFSPVRYQRLMNVLAAIQPPPEKAEESSEEQSAPAGPMRNYHDADLAGDVWVLAWGGMANTTGHWQQRWLVLSGQYLYQLEAESARTHLKYTSLSGKQVVTVSPEQIGGWANVIAICDRGIDTNKAAENGKSLLIRCRSEVDMKDWFSFLIQAVYRASAPAALASVEPQEEVAKPEEADSVPATKPLLYFVGVLDELKIALRGQATIAQKTAPDAWKETAILELRARGSRVELLKLPADLLLGIGLRSLEIEDKLHGHMGSCCRFIARSLSAETPTPWATPLPQQALAYSTQVPRPRRQSDKWLEASPSLHDSPLAGGDSDDDGFTDAMEEFGSPDSIAAKSAKLGPFASPTFRNEVPYLEQQAAGPAFEPPSLLHKWGLLPGKGSVEKVEGKLEGEFVKLQIIIRNSESPEYDRVDTQLAIQMATLDFFCNRPTVVALIEFGLDVAEVQSLNDNSASPERISLKGPAAEQAAKAEPDKPKEDLMVVGLLGRGKVRVICQLLLDMETARVYLNNEDGSQMAMLLQEKLHIDIKVFPASYTVFATLGNLKIRDLSLSESHQYAWPCDMRDPGGGSLVQVNFKSYSKQEEDWAGYEYSLEGRLLAVRLIFLYRFVQELIAYFLELATPGGANVVGVVEDAGVVRQIRQFEMDGAVALKLDISADSPVVMMPKDTHSSEFMQLDLGHLQLSNSFEWRGGPKSDPSAIHMDTMHIKGQDLNFVVGIDGKAGQPMIPEVKGLLVTVHRPLRDIFHRLPEVQVDVQMHRLRAVMSDKEYYVITDCASSNVAEPPNLPSTFRVGLDPNLQRPQPPPRVRPTSPVAQATGKVWTTQRVTVNVDHAELELYTGVERQVSLARVELQGLWFVWRGTSNWEMHMLFTLPRFLIIDTRDITKAEMRHIVGCLTDTDPKAAHQASAGGSSPSRPNLEDKSSQTKLTMLVMDMKLAPDSRTIMLRVQKPRLLVSIDFLIAVVDYFVPSFHAVAGKMEEDAADDPIVVHGNIRLEDAVHIQQDAEVWLSPERQLEADAPHVKEFVYDGNGGLLLLLNEAGGQPLTGRPAAPLILVGNGKRLLFKNIRIRNGSHLDECIHLGSDSSYCASPEDGVILEELSTSKGEQKDSPKPEEDLSSEDLETLPPQPAASGAALPILKTIIDIQALSPELTFYDTTKWPVGSILRPERLLRAKVDFNMMFNGQGEDQWLRASLKGVQVEAGSGLSVVDPFDISASYSHVRGKKDALMNISSVSIRLSFNVLRLIQRLQADVMSTFNLGFTQATTRCTQFDSIWINDTACNSAQQVAIWRPRCPPGYAILGDCATSGAAPPSQAVIAISTAYQRVRRPVGFKLVWSSTGHVSPAASESESPARKARNNLQQGSSSGRELRIWLPTAPPGYVSVGCVAWKGASPPPPHIVQCVRADLLSSAVISDCIYFVDATQESGGSFSSSSIWRVENVFGSFIAHMDPSPPSPQIAYDIRDILRYTNFNTGGMPKDSSAGNTKQLLMSRSMDRRVSHSRSGLDMVSSRAGKCYTTVAQFERIWWDKGGEMRQHVSIWRPVAPPGYVMVGDCAVGGYEPPSTGLALRDDGSGRLARPTGFKARAHMVGRNIEEATVWMPVPPAGYVALGCVASRGAAPPDADCVRCVRMDLVNQVNFSGRPIWECPGNRTSCSFWQVENQADTFICRNDLKMPPWRIAYGLAELSKPKLPDNLAVELKAGRVSCTVYDDFWGLMSPLLDATVNSVTLAAHGRTELLNAVVIAEMAASTFNSQLDTWEPLIEPWEGLIKFESNNDSSEHSLPAGTRVRIAASKVVNVNISTAGVEALSGAAASWRKNVQLEEDARKELQLALVEEEEGAVVEEAAALDQDDFAKVAVENHLGTEIFVKAVDDSPSAIQQLPSGESIMVHLPPPTFPELYSNVSEEARRPRRFMALRVLKAEGLSPGNGVVGQEYLCALQVVTQMGSSEDAKPLPQSARTRCVSPLKSLADVAGPCEALWEEVFVFEIPPVGESTVEVIVYNQAANCAQGEPVGVTLVPMSQASDVREARWSYVGRAAQAGEVASAWPASQAKLYPLQALAQEETDAQPESLGYVTLGQSFFVLGSKESDAEKIAKGIPAGNRSVQLGVGPEGPWHSIRSVLALATYPEKIGDMPLAVNVHMKQGLKNVELRSLVVVSNETDVPLAVCICPRPLLDQVDEEMSGDAPLELVEEVYENQRYQPLGGWGSKWPGHLLPTDPARWSNKDLTQSSQDFIGVQLPPGWAWRTDWHVDKAGHVDVEGWAYGMEWSALRWPLPSPKASKKGPFDFVRRRRWLRTRKRATDGRGGGRVVVGVVAPGESMPMPWGSTKKSPSYCVQVRPNVGQDALQTWGRAVPHTEIGETEESSSSERRRSSQEAVSRSEVPPSIFMLSELSKTEELLFCAPNSRLSARTAPVWLCMESDAAILYSDLNQPVYDWKLSVRAALVLENLLPCAAEYLVFEKPHRLQPVLRQRGVVASGKAVQVYSVDIRRPVFVAWLPQGGWKAERDIILVSDPSRGDDLPTAFLTTNLKTGRKLLISIEHDLGGVDVAAKVVRFYVPYWLRNDTQMPLSYRLMEIEPAIAGSDTPRKWVAKATKAMRSAAQPTALADSSSQVLQKAVQNLEVIEETDGSSVMLSLPPSERVGLAVSLSNNGIFSSALPFKALEEKMERLDMNAVDKKGVYFKISAMVEMSSYGFERTKVIRLQPHTVFTNRLGQAIFLQQLNTAHEEILSPSDVAKPLLWQSIWEPELLQVRTEGSHWSHPFSVGTEGVMHVSLRHRNNSRQVLRVEVRNGVADSRCLVVFRSAAQQGPYRVENRSMVLPIRCRQVDTNDESWQLLQPAAAASFNWEDLQKRRLLEVLVEGADPSSTRCYNIDEEGEYDPLDSSKGPVAALHISVFREGAVLVLRVLDWKPSTADLAISRSLTASASTLSVMDGETGGGDSAGEVQLHIILDMADFGLSLIDHTPEELLYLSMQGASLSYSTGLGSGTSRIKFRVAHLQVDNQLGLTPMPVLLAPQEAAGVRPEFVLKFTLSMQTASDDVQLYPYVGVQWTDQAWLLYIHEPVVWRLVEMFKRLKLGGFAKEETTAVTVDPRVKMGLLNISDLKFKLTLVTTPAQRPRGILGFWSTVVTSVGNTNEMALNFSGRVREDIHMRRSALLDSAVRAIRNDILGQPFHLISGMDILGNASSVIGTVSKGVAALSMDRKFLRSRSKQESKANVEDLGDGLREGGEAFAKGLFRGVTGIVTKPMEGLQSGGVQGFAAGIAKGLVGAAAQPVSGMLDFVSKTTDGVNAQRLKIAAAISSQQQLHRRRLPRAIGGDNFLRPYDDYKGRGQMILRLAERGTYFGQWDFFKERAKFATSDAYEDHFNLPKARTLVITHRRVIMLQHPTSLSKKRPDLLKEACSIEWDVSWDDFMTMELLHSKHDAPNAPYSRLVIHLRNWSQDARLFEAKEIARVVKCHPGTKEAEKIRAAIQAAYDAYGPDRATIAALTAKRRAQKKPYAGAGAGAASGAALGFLAGPAAPIAVPVMATFGALVGGAGQMMLENDEQEAAHQRFLRNASNRRKSMDKDGQRQLAIQGPGTADSATPPAKVVTHFKLMWWDKGAAWSRRYPVSIWRPLAPEGYIAVGDIVRCGYDPPERAQVYRDDGDGLFAEPEGFDLIWRDTDSGAREPVTIWRLRPPPGYVALGCLAVPDYYEPDTKVVRCVRRDSVYNARFALEPTWRDHKGAALWQCSLWQVANESSTFLARRDHNPPPPGSAYGVISRLE